MKTVLLLLTACLPLKLWPPAEPEPAVLAVEQREGYRCELITYNVTEDERVQSYLLIPDSAAPQAPCPGLVLLHDHGARFDIGKEKLVRPMADAPEYIKASAAQWVADGFDGVYLADRLAREGFVVVVPDALYWGSRSSEKCREWSRTRSKALKKEVYEGQRAVYDSLQRHGIVWAEKTLNEDAAAARLLHRLPYVQKDRIGCFGWSMGGHRAWLLAAFCPEVSSGAALCWMTLKRTQAQPPSASDYSMMIPALREKYDFPDIARWLAPKPFLFLNGMQDRLFPADASREAFGRMQEIYLENGAPGLLRTEFFEGGHHCGLREQQLILDFLKSFARPCASVQFPAPTR